MPLPSAFHGRRVEFEIDGRRWPLLITYGVLLECESLTGKDMLAAMHPSMLSALLLRALLYSCLIRAGAQVSLEQVGAAISPQSINDVRRLLSDAYRVSMAEPKAKAEKGSGQQKTLSYIDLWAEAVTHFNLTDEAWQAMTPKQFAALREAEIQRNLPLEMMLANLTAHTVFYSAKGPQKFPPYERYMLHPPDKPEAEDKPMTGDEMMTVFSTILRGVPKS